MRRWNVVPGCRSSFTAELYSNVVLEMSGGLKKKSPAVTWEFVIQSNLSYDGEKTAPWLCVHEHVNVCFLSPCRYSDSFISGVRESSEISSLFPLCLHRLHVLRARRTCLKCVFSSLQVSRPSWQIPAWGGTPLWELPSGWLLRYSKNWPINAPAASSLSTTLAWSRSQWATVNNHQRDNTVRYNVHGKKKR